MIWHWKKTETIAGKLKQQFKQLSVHFSFVAFLWKTSLLILAFKCDIYGRVISRPCIAPHKQLPSVKDLKKVKDIVKANLTNLQSKRRLNEWREKQNAVLHIRQNQWETKIAKSNLTFCLNYKKAQAV